MGQSPPEEHASVDLPDDESDHEHTHDPSQAPEGGWKAPLTWACKGERAYLASSLTFLPPTPALLVSVLAKASPNGVTLVLRKQGEQLFATLSATETRAAGREAFPAGVLPPFLRVVDGFGDPPGISSERFQPHGVLRISGGERPSWLEIQRVNWRAAERGGCDELSVDVFAQLPPSQWDLQVPTSAGLQPLRSFLDADQTTPSQPRDGVAPVRKINTDPPPVPLHFAFKATPVAIEPFSP